MKCPHSTGVNPDGVLLVTVGNSLRSDDGIAAALVKTLPESVMQNVCKFDLGPYTGVLADCLVRHKAAIIVDATSNGTAPGTVSILDLGSMLGRASVLNIQSSHGLSWLDELNLAKKQGKLLPKRIVFFGIEISNTDWEHKITSVLEKELPKLITQLLLLISTAVETLKKDA